MCAKNRKNRFRLKRKLTKMHSHALRSADGHSRVTLTLPRTVGAIGDKSLANWDTDCRMMFHSLFVLANKSAKTLTPAPHSLLVVVLILRPIITPVSQLPCLWYKLFLWCRMSVIQCVPRALRALRTL